MSDPYQLYLDSPTRERYAQFVAAYMPSVQRLVRRLLPSFDIADDVIQETFVRLARAKKCPDEIENPRSYVLGVAFHLVQHHTRRSAIRLRHEQKAGRLRTKLHPPASEEVIAKESIFRLHEAIDALPALLRIVMHLRAIEGFSYQEISVVTGCSVKAVSARVSRARKRLKSHVGETQLSLSLLKLKDLEPDAWLLEPPGRSPSAEARALLKHLRRSAAATPAKAGSPMGMGIVCLCVAILGFVLVQGAPHAAPGISPLSRGRERESNPQQQTWSTQRMEAEEASSRRHRRSGGRTLLPSGSPQQVYRTEEMLSREKILLHQPKEGALDMRVQVSSLAPILLSLGMSGTAHGAETGDFDGDGRLSIRDIVYVNGGGEPAPGSLDAYSADPCFGNTTWTLSYIAGGNLYLESLRRGVPHPLPQWDPFPGYPADGPPLPQDPARVLLRVEDVTAPGGNDDTLQLALVLNTSATVTHFSLRLEADGDILRVDTTGTSDRGVWQNESWRHPDGIFGGDRAYDGGDVPVEVGIPPYWISGGKFVLTHGFSQITIARRPVPPGVHTILVGARLPRGTARGRYAVRVLPASEVLLEDGTLLSPAVEAGGSIVVEKDVTGGWDGSPPPLQVDPERREVLGKIEFRLTDADGNPADVIAEGQPGDLVTLRAQIRTEVPLNYIACSLDWPQGKLICEVNEFGQGGDPALKSNTNLFLNPEDGELYPIDKWNNFCGDLFSHASYSFNLAGYDSRNVRYPDRYLEYFKPLGEWRDLVELRLRISDRALPGEEIPIELPLPAPTCSLGGPGTPAQYSCSGELYPYSRQWVFCDTHFWPDACKWSYPALSATGARVRVLEGPPPPPPTDYGIFISLSDASGAPGEVVDMPFFASADSPLDLLRLALELDPAVAVVESVEVRVTSGTLEERWESLPRGAFRIFEDCVDFDGDGIPDHCTFSLPLSGQFHPTDAQFVFLDIQGGSATYPGVFPAQIGTLKARIQEDPAAPETSVQLARVPYEEGAFPALAESGGTLHPPDPEAGFAAVKTFDGGKITVLGFQPKHFLRGDSNGDGKVDLSDAVATLGFLFLGNTDPACLDAADADDSGKLEITDAIFLLSALFLGTKTIPEPYPACGIDLMPDALGCKQGCR